jgi:2-polyprenyl-6-methoxyphenol hydroxylase-like FAD-dependent oxidoreductase
MTGNSHHIVVVGGGIAGSCIGRAMAQKGARVLILERETEFKDRVRGEALLPWGVAETQELGVRDLLRETCAHEQPLADFYFGPTQLMRRDFASTTPQRQPMLTFYHPKMQDPKSENSNWTGIVRRRRPI